MRDLRPTLLDILKYLDIARFRVVVNEPDATDAQILEALHRARVEHPGINRKQKADSQRWLNEQLH